MRLGLAGLALLMGISLPARAAVLLDEAKVRADLRPGGTVVVLPFVNDGAAAGGTAKLAWLDRDDNETGTGSRDIRIPPGRTAVEVRCPLQKASIWTRLRYTVDPDLDSTRQMGRLHGMLPLAHISDQVFVLRGETAGKARVDGRLIAYARAVHPVTGKAAEGVIFAAALSANGDEFNPVSTVRMTDGTMAFTFASPADGESADVAILAQRGEFSQEVSLEVEAAGPGFTANVQSDKPMYQPGQTLHMRAVLRNGKGVAAAGLRTVIRVIDDEGNRLYSREVAASRFGIIHGDYPLLETAESGQYQIVISTTGDQETEIGRHVVSVRRYELPAFTVSAKPDRAVFLPGQRPALTVQGTYLFGKPVANGRVKIVRRGRDEAEVSDGAANEDGSFRTELDVEEIGDGEDSVRFVDTEFEVYFTDTGSGRTEQRRVTVRQSREPLHVYVRGSSPAYVLTYAADGEPVSAAVTVIYGNESATVQTNRLGVGKLRIPFVAGDPVLLTARNAAGRTGHWRTVFYGYPRPVSQVEIERTIYRAGEAVRVRVTGTVRSGAPVLVHAVADGRLLETRPVVPGGETTFPYQPGFRGKVIFATAEVGSRVVVFPFGEDLQVRAVAGRPVYRPGEKAEVTVQVMNRDRKPVVAALGVAVVDPAVGERARTDAEFGGRRWFRCYWCEGGPAEIGGVRLEDLVSAKQISPEMDLLAEAMLAGSDVELETDASESWEERPNFSEVRRRMDEIRVAIRRDYADTLEFPRDDGRFFHVLGSLRDRLTDPWETPYKVEYGVAGSIYTIVLRSAGPDRRHGTADDFVAGTIGQAYFQPLGKLMGEALARVEDFPGTEAELAEVLRAGGLAWEGLRDPWGNRYFARIEDIRGLRHLEIRSAGPDGKPGNGDDVRLETYRGTYFSRESARIQQAILEMEAKIRTADEYTELLRRVGIHIADYRDAWGRPYRFEVRERVVRSQLGQTRTVVEYGKPANVVTELVPRSQTFQIFSLRSAGPDGVHGTYDDFELMQCSVAITPISEDSPSDGGTTPLTRTGTGRISGVVTDPTGAVVANAEVTLIDERRQSFSGKSGPDGRFYFTRVPAGRYKIRVQSPGFQRFDMVGIRLHAGQQLELVAQIDVGSVTEMVTVEAESPQVMTSMASAAQAPEDAPVGTPRVREYFPETLLWLPEVVTDTGGVARLTVPLADTVTNWKVAVFASTVDGRMAEAEGEVRAFQPFFLDLDPPAVLTEGDRVELPVTVRNYSEAAETVRVSLAGAGERTVALAPGASGQAAFPVTAERGEGKGVLTLRGQGTRNADAVRKSIVIRPDGQRQQRTVSDVLDGDTVLTASIPEAAIPDATRGELRLYPNFGAMLLEGAEGVLEAPHGCAEQTTSGGYSNLIAWRYAKAMGVRDAGVEAMALRHVRIAVERVAGYTGKDGGVRYWGKGDADLAVTAYALQFLVEASGFVAVDRGLMERMANWLVQQQREDGRWVAHTSLVVRALASAHRAGIPVAAGSLASGIHVLGQQSVETDPYGLAYMVLALLDSEKVADAATAVARLAAAGNAEADGLYWATSGETPYHGWGLAGRLETTGAVVSALAAWRAGHPGDEAAGAALRGGVLYLLRHRDERGGWRSTQGTVRAMRALADARGVAGPAPGSGGELTVEVNGRTVRTVRMVGVDVIRVDVSAFLASGENRVRLKGGSGTLARLSLEHWVRWERADPAPEGDLAFNVSYDRTDSALGETVLCKVGLKRVGGIGSGMLLAEVALPPGTEVDRASLEGLPVDRYEVLPDRVVFYVWPQLGGVEFSFPVRSRMRIAGKTGVSKLYDYYNPEAAAEVRPVRWEVN